MKQLLNTGRGHQTPRKAAHSLRKEVTKYKRQKERQKRGTKTHPEEGVVEDKFPNIR